MKELICGVITFLGLCLIFGGTLLWAGWPGVLILVGIMLANGGQALRRMQ